MQGNPFSKVSISVACAIVALLIESSLQGLVNQTCLKRLLIDALPDCAALVATQMCVSDIDAATARVAFEEPVHQ